MIRTAPGGQEYSVSSGEFVPLIAQDMRGEQRAAFSATFAGL